MNIDFSFPPDAARARALDRRMHRELGLSLEHVGEAAHGIVDFDEAALRSFAISLQGNATRCAPATFGRYYDLVDALLLDRVDDAEALFGELVAMPPACRELEVVDLGSDTLGVENDRYSRMMNADENIELGFLPPLPEVAAAFRDRLRGGFRLLDQALPELAGEIRAIVRQVVIAGSDPTKKYQFDGGSHYQLWGALFLNGSFHQNEMAVVEVLAHECAHSLLFGFCTDEALVENDDAELFASPLRMDKRPMDGIYHATFVSARMHWAMSELARGNFLSVEQRELAHDAANADLRNFDAGYGVVREHGQLTGVGRALMASAKEYVDAAR